MKIDDIQSTGKSNCFVSTYNQQDIPFTKVFEDEGFEDLREDTEIYLYGNDIRNDTITLKTSSNKSQKEWQGVFKNKPIYDSNWRKIDYRIEEKKNDNYTTYYDSEDYNGLAIKFSKDSYLDSNTRMQIYYKKDNKYFEASHYGVRWHDESTTDGTSCAISDATIYIPSKEFFISVENSSTTTLGNNILRIESIKPIANFERQEGSGAIESSFGKYNVLGSVQEHTGKDYLNLDANSNIYIYNNEYTRGFNITWRYKYSDIQSILTDRIINKINKQEVKKIWNDGGSKISRPESVKIDIYNAKNPNSIVKTVELTSKDEDKNDGNVWKKIITGLPEYDENGYKINYIFKEDESEDYEATYDSSRKITGYEITLENGTNMYDFVSDVNILSYSDTNENKINSYYRLNSDRTGRLTDGLTNKIIIPVITGNENYKENESKIAFYRKGLHTDIIYKIDAIRPLYSDEYQINEEYYIQNSSRETFWPSDEVFEIPQEGSCEMNTMWSYYVYTPQNTNSFSGSNIITNKEIYARDPVTKIWDDEENQDGKRPSEATVNLFADGVKIKSEKIKASDGWKYTFSKLPIYNEQGQRIVYSITEDEIKGYSSNIEGYTITNSYVPEKIEISGEKIWKDNNNQEGKRPEKAKIYLYADGELIDSTEVSKETNWKYKFSNLPKYRDGGKEIVYTVDEDEIENYKTDINGFNITNTYIGGQEDPNEDPKEEHKEKADEAKTVQTGDVKIKIIVGILIFSIMALVVTKVVIKKKNK